MRKDVLCCNSRPAHLHTHTAPWLTLCIYQLPLKKINFSSAAVIGFLQDYIVIEGVNSTVDVDIQLLSRELGRDVVVKVLTDPDSAQGKLGSSFFCQESEAAPPFTPCCFGTR